MAIAAQAATSSRPKRNVSARFSNGTSGQPLPLTSRGNQATRTTDDQDDDSELSDAESVDSFDSGSEQDMDETGDFIAPGSRPLKKARISKISKSTKNLRSAGPRGRSAKASISKSGKRRPAASLAKAVLPRTAANREELVITEDVPLFQSLKNPEAALKTTVEDWVIAYQGEPGPALAELINFFLRCCACNSSIDEDKTMDLDNVVDTLEEVQEEFKKNPMPSYPLISRAPMFKKFRKSLAEFLSRLIETAAESDLLLNSPRAAELPEDVSEPALINVLTAWISSLSSSSFRSLRHTSTFISLNVTHALAALWVEKHKTVEVAKKQRDLEKTKPRPDKNRLATLEERFRDEKHEEARVNDGMRDLIDGVLQHRYRDSDALIRTDCAQELGSWLKTHPDVFLKNEFTRILGWCLSDTASSVRLASIQALAPLYSKSAFPDALNHFTEVTKGRLVQMAVKDVDVAIREASIDILVHIDRRGLLDEDQQDEIGVHIFDSDVRIRQQVGRFLKGLIEEELQEQVDSTIGPAPVSAQAASKDPKSKEERSKWESEVEKLRLKILAAKLVEYETRLDDSTDQTLKSVSMAEESGVALAASGTSRIGLAIQAIWTFSPTNIPLSDWEVLLEMLLYDHTGDEETSETEEGARKGANRKQKRAHAAAAVSYSGSQPANEAYRLTSSEETTLLETLVTVATVTRRLAVASSSSAADDEAESQEKERLDNLTRALISALPKLFAKYRTESARVSLVLETVPVVDLDLYAATGQISTIGGLWDEVSAQFLRHSEPTLLKRGAVAIRFLSSASAKNAALNEVTASKLGALQESLIAAIRNPLKGKEVATSAFDDDTTFALQANVERLGSLSSSVDCSDLIEDTEGGSVSSGWELMRELSLRARLGYEGEEGMLATCLRVMTIHLLWRLRAIMASKASASNESERASLAEDLRSKRDEMMILLDELVGRSPDIHPQVKNAAAARMLQLYLAFHSASQLAASGGTSSSAVVDFASSTSQTLRTTPSRSSQANCVQVVLSQIASYLAHLHDSEAANDDPDGEEKQDDASDAEDDEEEGAARPRKTSKNTKKTSPPQPPNQAQLRREVELTQSLSPLVSAMRFGIVSIDLATPFISKFGQVGKMYDVLVKVLIEVLREEGVLAGEARVVTDVLWNSLKESFENFLKEGTTAAESHFVSLSRSLSSALVVRGAHLAILRALDASALVDLHERGSKYVMDKFAAAQRANSKPIKARAPAFFKGLSNLLVSCTARDAQKIKNAMDKAISQAKVEIPAASKAWEPQRQYEKRLLTQMSKRAPLTAVAQPTTTPRKSVGEAQRKAKKPQGESSPAVQNRSQAKPTAVSVSPAKKRARSVDEDDEDSRSLSSAESDQDREVQDLVDELLEAPSDEEDDEGDVSAMDTDARAERTIESDNESLPSLRESKRQRRR